MSLKKRGILISGASGFIGQNFLASFDDEGLSLFPFNRSQFPTQTDIEGLRELSVVHFAGRAHVLKETTTDPSVQFRSANVDYLRSVALRVSEAGAKRIVFLSSINVMFKELRSSDFSVSKIEAEEVLKEICSETGMEYVIIRPPLVYGPGVKANFLSMLKWVARGVPLPLGGIRHNKRSLVYVENLVDLIKVCIEHPAAANQTFLVSDDEDVSTRELLIRIAKALGVTSRLLPIPPSWLGFAGRLLGKKNVEQRLCGSLQVDVEHTKTTLGWKPSYSMEEGLARTAEWYKNRS